MFVFNIYKSIQYTKMQYMIQACCFLISKIKHLIMFLTVLMVLNVLIVLLVLHVLPGRSGRGQESVATKP